MIKKIYFVFQSNFIVALLSLINTIILVKYTGTVGVGIITMFMLYVSLGQVVTDIIGSGIMFFLIKKYKVLEIILISNLWILLITGLSTIILYFLDLLSDPYLILFFFYLLLSPIFSVNKIIILNKIGVKIYNLLMVLQPFLVLALILILKLETLTIYKYLLYQIIIYLIINLTSYYLFRRELKIRIDYKILPELFRESINLGFQNQMASLAQFSNYRLSYFFLEKFSGLSAVGIFNIIMSFCNLIWLFAVSVGTILANKISKTTNKVEIYKQTLRYLTLSVLITFVLLIVLNITPIKIFSLVLNKDFNNVKTYLLYFSPAILVFSIAKVLGFYFSSLGYVKINLKSSLIGLIPTLLMSFFLVKEYSIYGAIICSSISFFFSTLIMCYYFFLWRYKLFQ
jgi:O-antigen/teichoic acid export membrane protein